MPGENSLTLSSLLSAMQILLIREVLADLSIMIIATPDTKSLATFIFLFGFFCSSAEIMQRQLHSYE